MIHLPLVLPPVVIGYFLLVAFGRKGPLGVLFEQVLGLTFAFRWTGAALAAGIAGPNATFTLVAWVRRNASNDASVEGMVAGVWDEYARARQYAIFTDLGACRTAPEPAGVALPQEEIASAEPVGRSGANRAVTPVNQVLTPLGRTVELPGLRPQALALSSDGRILVTSGKSSEIVVVDQIGRAHV